MGAYLKVKPHSMQKYTILEKYLRACEKFARKYHNFFYVDTHGGSGIVEIESEGPLLGDAGQDKGSPLIAAQIIGGWKEGTFPCHVIEINPEYYGVLRKATQQMSWVTTHLGDCNEIAPSIVRDFPKKWAFGLCFMDPRGLVYRGPGASGPVDQLTWNAVAQISQRRKVEFLINFPLKAIFESSGFCQAHPDDGKSASMVDRLTTFFGTDEWWPLRGKREFLELYLHRLKREASFPHVGAYLVCSRGLAPLYYLIYATRHEVGAQIMHNVMSTEWKHNYPNKAREAEMAGWEPDLNYFVFDGELTLQPRYPPNWEEVACQVKEAAGWRCQECGHPHEPATNYILTIYPQDGNWANTSPDNLVALCQRCHLRAWRKRKSFEGEIVQLAFPVDI